MEHHVPPCFYGDLVNVGVADIRLAQLGARANQPNLDVCVGTAMRLARHAMPASKWSLGSVFYPDDSGKLFDGRGQSYMTRVKLPLQVSPQRCPMGLQIACARRMILAQCVRLFRQHQAVVTSSNTLSIRSANAEDE